MPIHCALNSLKCLIPISQNLEVIFKRVNKIIVDVKTEGLKQPCYWLLLFYFCEHMTKSQFPNKLDELKFKNTKKNYQK